MRTPNLNALHMFDAAARHLNFRLAAEELNLTQGAVAQQVRRLESDLGRRLFDRKARGLALTAEGRNYHTPIRRALAIIAEATQKLRPEHARVTLSVTPSLASKWLVPRLPGFTAAHPEIELRTVASEALADFRSDGVDLSIRMGVPPFGVDLDARLLAPLELCAVCSPSYAGQAAAIERFEDFAHHALLQDSHNYWDSLLGAAGIQPQRRAMQFNQTALAMDAAANGQGVALAPWLLLEADIAQGKLIELWRGARSDQVGFYVICPAGGKSNPARDAVSAWVVSEAALPTG